MPDWFSHILAAMIICEIFNIDKKSLVIIGSLLPDLLFKITVPLILLGFDSSILYKFTFPNHTLIGSFILALLISALFRYNPKKSISLISIGFLSHFILDLLQYNVGFGQNILIFPFSWINFEIGLLRINQFIYPILILSFVYIVMVITKRIILKTHYKKYQD